MPESQDRSKKIELVDVNPKDFVSPKSILETSLKEKLEFFGMQVLPANAPDPYGINESKDLFLLLATVTNKVVNKDTFLDFSLAQKAFAAYKDAKQIPKELNYLTEAELEELKALIAKELKFDNPDKAKLEILIEKLSFAGLLILQAITEYANKTA